MTIKLVICDWAGTTVDYGCFAPIAALKAAFHAFDIEPTDEELRAPMGMGKKDHIRTMLQMERLTQAWKATHGADFTEDDVEKIYAVFNEQILETLGDPIYAKPKAGVVETIAQLREQGIHIAGTTGYTAEMMTRVEPSAKEQGYAPDLSVTSESVGGFGRPYPYMIFKAIKHFEVPSVQQVIKIGDTITDIKEGVHAGVLSCGVIEGSSDMGLTEEEYNALSTDEQAALKDQVRQDMLAAGATAVFDTFSELVPYIQELNA